MQNPSFQKSSSLSTQKLVCAFATGVILALLAAAPTAQADESVESTRPVAITCQIHTATWQISTRTIQAQPGYEWRKTSEGWKQIPMGNVAMVHNLELPSYEPAIHPLNVTAMIVLLSLAAMAWVSNEWDWDRFTNA